MRLCIFNFKNRKFFKIFIITLLLFISFNYFLAHIIPFSSCSSNQWQDNVIRAQRYYFSRDNIPYIIVGSSIARRIDVNEISKNWSNIAMSGGCSITGLDILMKKNSVNGMVKFVWVEVNGTVMRGTDKNILNKISKFYNIPLTRDYERPDYIFNSTLQFIYNKIYPKKIQSDNNSIPDISTLNRIQNEYDSDINEEMYKKQLRFMKEKIDKLQKVGINIILFEPPLSSQLYHSREVSSTRRISLEIFPRDQYNWKFYNWENYNTSDGIHLQEQSAQRLAKEIIAATEKISLQ